MTTRWILRSLLLATLHCAAATAQAQAPTAARYPWDARPAQCSAPEAAATPACKVDDWPTLQATREQLDMLVSTLQFALLERALRELATSEQPSYPDGTSKAGAVLGFLGDEVRQHKIWPANGPSPSRLTRWAAQFPGSDFVAIAQALQLPRAAGEKRLAQLSPDVKASPLLPLAQLAMRDGMPPPSGGVARGEPYPWDTRPIKCSAPAAAGMPMCAFDHWPNRAVTDQRLASLVERSRWQMLERALSELSASGGVFPDGSTHAGAVLKVIAAVARSAGAAPAPTAPLAQWRAAHPDSSFVLLVEAVMLRTQAWAARGEGAGSTVSPQSWAIFREKLGQAKAKLLTAPPSIQDTGAWHALRLQVALDQGDRKDAAQVFTQAVAKWPRQLQLYEAMAARMLPKWGGSWQMLEAFIDHSARALEATEGNATYARMYVDLDDQIEGQGSLKDWTRMKLGFEDWIARYPGDRPRNLYASHACRARDKDGFARAMRHLPRDKVRKDEWLAAYSYDACVRWAGI